MNFRTDAQIASLRKMPATLVEKCSCGGHFKFIPCIGIDDHNQEISTYWCSECEKDIKQHERENKQKSAKEILNKYR